MSHSERRLRAEAIALMKMNGMSVLDIARKLRLAPSTVRNAMFPRKKKTNAT
jgi:lambda repressor-like predicted transcriptional regulator